MDSRDRQDSDYGALDTGRSYPATSGYYDPYEEYHTWDEERSGANWMWLTAGAVMAVTGGYLLYRAMSNRGGSHTRDSQGGMDRGKGIQVRKSITVDRPVGEIYRFWRNLENLPQIMSHLESVTPVGDGRSHWVAKGPMGTKVEWDAQTVQERENELLSWRSIEGSDVPNEGTVHFRDRGASTEIHVSLSYRPPGGALGAGIARLFGREPSQQIGDDLRNFKRKIETGEITTSAYSQPSGRLGGTAEL